MKNELFQVWKVHRDFYARKTVSLSVVKNVKIKNQGRFLDLACFTPKICKEVYQMGKNQENMNPKKEEIADWSVSDVGNFSAFISDKALETFEGEHKKEEKVIRFSKKSELNQKLTELSTELKVKYDYGFNVKIAQEVLWALFQIEEVPYIEKTLREASVAVQYKEEVYPIVFNLESGNWILAPKET